MRILLVFIVLILCQGCASQRAFKKIKRHHQKIEYYSKKISDLLLLHPELADSFRIKDPLKTESAGDSLTVINDPSKWSKVVSDSADAAVVATAETIRAVMKTPEVGDSILTPEGIKIFDGSAWAIKKEREQRFQKLQKIICPKVTWDSTFDIHLHNSKISFFLPVKVFVQAAGGKLSVKLSHQSMDLPESKEIPCVQFKPADKIFYKDEWFWIAIFMTLVTVGVIIQSIRSK